MMRTWPYCSSSGRIDAMKRHYYPSLFRGGPVIDPVAGANAAREVVNAWH